MMPFSGTERQLGPSLRHANHLLQGMSNSSCQLQKFLLKNEGREKAVSRPTKGAIMQITASAISLNVNDVAASAIFVK